MDLVHYLIPLAVGAAAGVMGGVFGVSGGTIAISTLSLLGTTQQYAQGTSMVMQLPNLLLGAWHYTRRGGVNVRASLTLSAAAFPFTYIGAYTATHLPSRDLRIAFSIFFFFIGTFTLWNALRTRKQLLTLPLHWYYLAALGAIGGFATGMFGIGGPALAIPTLVAFFGVTQTVAQGMALYLSGPATVVSLITYARAGDVDWVAGILLAIGGALLVPTGVAFAHRLPERTLRLMFCGFMYAMATLLLLLRR